MHPITAHNRSDNRRCAADRSACSRYGAVHRHTVRRSSSSCGLRFFTQKIVDHGAVGVAVQLLPRYLGGGQQNESRELLFRLAEHLRPLGFTALRRLLVQPLHSGLRLCDKTIVLLLTACAGILDDLCGLLLGGSKLRGVRGLLLFGGVGTGKTYTAACIANELLAQGVSVVMTSLVKLIENGISDLCSRLSAIDLLILDDLGAERSTDYALEQVYNIVDSRYRAGLPVIYTTNLTLEELKNPADMRYARIYDRVLEKCFPVEFRGVSRRKHGARQGFDDMMALLGVDDTT